ncbi:MAG: alanine:cation symporter family protein, partial [Myxococcota bacterium]
VNRLGQQHERFGINWEPIAATTAPTLANDPSGAPDRGIYGDYTGATLTAYAFDRVTPGLGKWLVSLAAWLFAISTMISWSYYGEQGVVYLSGERLVLPYRIVYCLLIVVTTLPNFITTDAELDSITTLGLGVMLVANIPIMLMFSRESMAAYYDYFDRLSKGTIKRASAPSNPPPKAD